MEKKQNWTYCVVGNIKKTHYDADGTLRYGTAAFTGGTKVYISGRIWDRTRDHINALGLTRGKQLEVIWTDVSQIENLRCQKVFQPTVLGLWIILSIVTDGGESQNARKRMLKIS